MHASTDELSRRVDAHLFVGSPEVYVNEDQRRFLIELLRKHQPKTCLEVGFYTGWSAIITLVAAQPKVMVSLDKDLGAISGVRQFVTVLRGAFPCLEVIEGNSRSLLNQPFFQKHFPAGVDYVFLDADRGFEGCYADLNAVFPYLSPGGVILEDDFMSGLPNGMRYPSVNSAVELFVLKNNVVLRRWHKQGKGVAVLYRPHSSWGRWKTLAVVVPRVLLRRSRERLSEFLQKAFAHRR